MRLQTDSTEAVRQPLVTAIAAAQISDEPAAAQFNADFGTATEDLVSWGEEDADTLDCLPTLWQPFADPTGFESIRPAGHGIDLEIYYSTAIHARGLGEWTATRLTLHGARPGRPLRSRYVPHSTDGIA